MISDTIIVRLRNQGESELGRLLECQRAHLKRFVDCRINQRLNARIDASDVIQEVYVRACNGLQNYLSSPVVPPLIWLRKLSKQILSEIHRKQFRQIRSPHQEQLDFDERFVCHMIDSTESVRTRVGRKEIAAKIRLLLTQLNEVDREVLEMRHMEGYSIREIANMLDLKQEAVKKRYYRALERFREILTEYPELKATES